MFFSHTRKSQGLHPLSPNVPQVAGVHKLQFTSLKVESIHSRFRQEDVFFMLLPTSPSKKDDMFTIFIEKKRWFPSGFFLWIPISRTLRRGFSWKATKLRWMRFSNSLSWSQQWLVMDGQIYQQHHVDEGTWFQYMSHPTPNSKIF